MSLFPVRFVMLGMQADKNNGWSVEKAGYGTGTSGDPKREKLLTG